MGFGPRRAILRLHATPRRQALPPGHRQRSRCTARIGCRSRGAGSDILRRHSCIRARAAARSALRRRAGARRRGRLFPQRSDKGGLLMSMPAIAEAPATSPPAGQWPTAMQRPRGGPLFRPTSPKPAPPSLAFRNIPASCTSRPYRPWRAVFRPQDSLRRTVALRLQAPLDRLVHFQSGQILVHLHRTSPAARKRSQAVTDPIRRAGGWSPPIRGEKGWNRSTITLRPLTSDELTRAPHVDGALQRAGDRDSSAPV